MIANIVRGALAGAVATVTMSSAMGIAKSRGLLGEPPPKKITRAALRQVAPKAAKSEPVLDVASVAMHLGFGMAMGALYGALPGAKRSKVKGALFGTAVWAVSYMGWVPAMGIMPMPEDDKPGRPESMVTAHWVYGATLASTMGMLGAR